MEVEQREKTCYRLIVYCIVLYVHRNMAHYGWWVIDNDIYFLLAHFIHGTRYRIAKSFRVENIEKQISLIDLKKEKQAETTMNGNCAIY